MASASASAAASSSSTTASPLKIEAFNTLRYLGLPYWTPSLSLDSIVDVTRTKLKVKIAASDFVLMDRVLQERIETVCSIVSKANWVISDDTGINIDEMFHGNIIFQCSTLPKPTEDLVITARVNEIPGSLPQLQYDAEVLRDGVRVHIIDGSSTVIVPDPLAARSTKQNRISPIVERPPRQDPETPLPVIITDPNFVDAIPTVRRAPPPQPRPIFQLPAPIRPLTWDPVRLRCYKISQDVADAPPTINQRFMCLAFKPEREVNYMEMNDFLKTFKVEPKDVALTQLGFFGNKQVVYYFDAMDDAAKAIVEANASHGPQWCKRFQKERLRKAEFPFIFHAMPLKEIYRTMLIASRLFSDGVGATNRLQAVADPQELRRAFRHKAVMSIRGELDAEGLRILRRLRREVGL